MTPTTNSQSQAVESAVERVMEAVETYALNMAICTPFGIAENEKAVREALRAALVRSLEVAAPVGDALTDDQIFEIADSDECNPDDRGWGPKFSTLKFARAIIAASRAPEPVAVEADMVLVPLTFLQGFNTLAHNYSLNAIPPDYLRGIEGDAFKMAYRRCGQDLAELRASLATPPGGAGGDVGAERERAATICEDFAVMMESGAGEVKPGQRFRQAARKIRSDETPLNLSQSATHAAEQGDAKGPDSFHSDSGDRDRAQAPGPTDAELALRRLLCLTFSRGLAYTDDGELSDSQQHPSIDFLRDAPADIEAKISQRNAHTLVAPVQTVLCEHSGCGSNTQVDSLSVRLNPGDKVVLLKGRTTQEFDRADAAILTSKPTAVEGK